MVYKYKYNGKELQDELGLNWYDYGARNYDMALGRWMNLDPLAEKYSNISPFVYVANNPTLLKDPNGKEIINIEGGIQFTGNDARIAFSSIKRIFSQNNSSSLRIHFVYESRTPNIYEHTLNAFRLGKPKILHYDPDPKRKAARRRESLKGYPTIPGVDRDEYPYASTYEGGKGALIAYVPKSENRSQGGSLSQLMKTMKDHEAFLVFPVPKNRVPDPTPVAKPRSKPIPFVPPINRTLPARAPIFERILLRFLPIIVVPYGTEYQINKYFPNEKIIY